MATIKALQARPVLKWAGGKTQLLDELLSRAPKTYGKYIESFFGGGALFFALKPQNAVIADSNPELINMYRQIANNVDEVIDRLKKYHNTQEEFYAVRQQNWMTLSPAEAAARMIYLNRTCFNGLYRVNRQGQFNVPYGKYKNPKICDEENLRQVSKALQGVEILCGDYLLVLEHYASAGDFIFLDPPYLPISENADFTLEINSEDFEMKLTVQFEKDSAKKRKVKTDIVDNHIILTCINFSASGTGLTTPVQIAVINHKKIYFMFWAYQIGTVEKLPKVRKIEYTLYAEE